MPGADVATGGADVATAGPSAQPTAILAAVAGEAPDAAPAAASGVSAAAAAPSGAADGGVVALVPRQPLAPPPLGAAAAAAAAAVSAGAEAGVPPESPTHRGPTHELPHPLGGASPASAGGPIHSARGGTATPGTSGNGGSPPCAGQVPVSAIAKCAAGEGEQWVAAVAMALQAHEAAAVAAASEGAEEQPAFAGSAGQVSDGDRACICWQVQEHFASGLSCCVPPPARLPTPIAPPWRCWPAGHPGLRRAGYTADSMCWLCRCCCCRPLG